MPNKILVPILDTIMNPNNIIKQAKRQQEKKAKSKAITQTRFSKESAMASKAYSSPQIKKSEQTHYKEIKLLDVALKAKKDAENIYAASSRTLDLINGKKYLKEARENNFQIVYDEYPEGEDLKIAYEYKKRQGKKPDVLTMYEYEDGELARKITLKDNGIHVSSITNYYGNSFEEMKFATGACGKNTLYEYTTGEITEFGTDIDKQYRYSGKNLGQLVEYRKGIRTADKNATLTDLVIKYNEKGECESVQEHILCDRNGTITDSDPKIVFQNEQGYYIVDMKGK